MGDPSALTQLKAGRGPTAGVPALRRSFLTMTLRSAEAEVYRKLYNDNQWKRLRKAKLQRNPVCERCLKTGHVSQATVVHHRVAHKGDRILFYDINNLESLCKPHHDGDAQSEEHTGYSRIVDDEGWPMDPKHPVNKYDNKVR